MDFQVYTTWCWPRNCLCSPFVAKYLSFSVIYMYERMECPVFQRGMHTMFPYTRSFMYHSNKCWLCPCRRENLCTYMLCIRALMPRPAPQSSSTFGFSPTVLCVDSWKSSSTHKHTHMPQTRENSHSPNYTTISVDYFDHLIPILSASFSCGAHFHRPAKNVSWFMPVQTVGFMKLRLLCCRVSDRLARLGMRHISLSLPNHPKQLM